MRSSNRAQILKPAAKVEVRDQSASLALWNCNPGDVGRKFTLYYLHTHRRIFILVISNNI